MQIKSPVPQSSLAMLKHTNSPDAPRLNPRHLNLFHEVELKEIVLKDGKYQYKLEDSPPHTIQKGFRRA